METKDASNLVRRLSPDEIWEGYSKQQRTAARLVLAITASQWVSLPVLIPAFLENFTRVLLFLSFLIFNDVAKRIVLEKRKRVCLEMLRSTWEIQSSSPLLSWFLSFFYPKVAVREEICLLFFA